jgi:hypothetical protein
MAEPAVQGGDRIIETRRYRLGVRRLGAGRPPVGALCIKPAG